MTALGKLLRTTAFRLTLVYLVVFAMFAAFLLGYFAWNTRRLVTEQITETVDAEITGLAEQYRTAASAGWCSRSSTRAAAGLEPLSPDHAAPARGWPAMSARSPPACSNTRAGRETAYRRIEDPRDGRAHALVRRLSSFRAASASWSAATSRSASGCSTIIAAAGRWSRRARGRARPRRRLLRGAARAQAHRRR